MDCLFRMETRCIRPFGRTLRSCREWNIRTTDKTRPMGRNSLKPPYQYLAHIIRIVDGDTVEVQIDLGFDQYTKRKLRVLAASSSGFDTPETYRPESEEERQFGMAATQRAEALLFDKTCLIQSVKKGKYRYVATITMPDGKDYGDTMIEEGYQKSEQ